MVLLNWGAFLSTFGFWWEEPLYIDPSTWGFWGQILTLVLMPIFYWYSRTIYYSYVAAGVGLFIMIWTFFTAMTPPYYPNAVIYLFATQLFYLVFLGEWAGLLSYAGTIVGTWLMVVFHPHIALYDVDLLFLVIIGGVLHVVYHFRSHLFQLQQQELSASESRYKRLVELNPDPVIVHDGERFLYVNRVGLRVAGLSAENDGMLDILQAGINEHFQQDGIFRSELEYQSKTGLAYRWEVISAPIEYNGRLARLFISRDVTHRYELAQRELQLRLEKERVELLQDFVRDVSHDLRTPITALDDKQRQHLEVLQQLTQRLNLLIEDLITMTQLDRMSTLNLETLDWHIFLKTLEEGFSTLAQQKEQHLSFDWAKETPPILADQNQLYRALGNLIENAIRYTPQGKAIHVKIYSEGVSVVCEVQDEGVGIAAEDLPHVFERFYRTDQARSMQTGGTGLGLAIVKRIAEMHGGKIHAESTLNEGTTFRLIFPLR